MLWNTCTYIYIYIYIIFNSLLRDNVPSQGKDIRYFLLNKICFILPSCNKLLPIGINRAAPTAAFDSWATSLFIGLQRGRTGDAEGCKGKIFFREYNPETRNIIGFLWHNSANTTYILNDKTSQQLKDLYMNKMFQCVTHLSSEFAH